MSKPSSIRSSTEARTSPLRIVRIVSTTIVLLGGGALIVWQDAHLAKAQEDVGDRVLSLWNREETRLAEFEGNLEALAKSVERLSGDALPLAFAKIDADLSESIETARDALHIARDVMRESRIAQAIAQVPENKIRE